MTKLMFSCSVHVDVGFRDSSKSMLGTGYNNANWCRNAPKISPIHALLKIFWPNFGISPRNVSANRMPPWDYDRQHAVASKLIKVYLQVRFPRELDLVTSR